MKLVVEQGELAGQEFALERPDVIIGRGKDSNIVLLEPDISRQHARLQRGPQGWTLVDLGTTNGTFVNGKRLPPQEPYLLRSGDRISLGSSVLAVQEPAAQAAPQPATPAQGLHPALLVAGAVLFVLVLAGIVALVVALLQPSETVATPTPINQTEQLMTVLPVPTELQGPLATVLPAIPSVMPGFPFGATATPQPPAAAAPQLPEMRDPGS